MSDTRPKPSRDEVCKRCGHIYLEHTTDGGICTYSGCECNEFERAGDTVQSPGVPEAGPPRAADAPLPDIPRIVKALAGWADYAARGVGTNPVPYVEVLPRMIRETLAAVESLARELAAARAELAAARRDRDRAEEMERYRAMELEQECRSLSAARADAAAAQRERDEATAHLMDAGRSAAQHAQRAAALAEALREFCLLRAPVGADDDPLRYCTQCGSWIDETLKHRDGCKLAAVLARHARGSP